MPPPLPPGFVLEGSTRPVVEFNSDVALPAPAYGQFPETYPAWVSTPAATAKPSGPPSSRLPALPPGFELEKPKEDVGYVTSAVRGAAEMIPLLGAAPRHLNAITQAAAEPLLSNDPTISHKPTFAERRAENLAREEAFSKTAEEQHPVVSTVAGLAGGLGAGGALLKAAPAAANVVFGLGAKTLPGQIAAGAASGAGVGGLDAALRGEDPTIAAGVGGALGGAIPVAGRAVSGVVNKIRDARALRDPAFAQQLEDAAARAVEVPGGAATAAGEAGRPGGVGGSGGVAQEARPAASPVPAVQGYPAGASAAVPEPAPGWWRAAGLTDVEAQRALENIERTHAPVTTGARPEPVFPSQEIQRGSHIDSMPTQGPVPESVATLKAQQADLITGRRPAQMFPDGVGELALPPGMQRVVIGKDVYHFNPNGLSRSEVEAAAGTGQQNEILGLGPVSKDEAIARSAATGEAPVAVVERTPAGTEVKAAAGTTGTAPAQVRALEAQKAPGNIVGVEDPAAVTSERMAKTAAEKVFPPPQALEGLPSKPIDLGERVAAPAPAVGAQASPAVEVAAAAPPRPAPVSTAGPVRSSGATDVPSVPSLPGISDVPLFEGSYLTVDGIKQAAQNGFRSIDQQGTRISPDATIGVVNRIATEMNARGFRPAYQPAVFRVLRRIAERETQGGSTFGDLMADLQYLNGLRTGVPDKNYVAAGVVKRAIENFMDNVKQADVIAGNPHEAVRRLQDANKNWSVYRIAEKIEQAIAIGRNNAKTAGNGRSNTTNAMLQAIKPLLKAVETKKLYVTPEVHQALKDVVHTKYGVARTLSKFAPTGAVSIGSSYLLGQGLPGDEHGITGALGLAALGLAAKRHVDRKTMARVAKLLETAKSASPAQQRFQALQPRLPSGGRISFGSLNPLDEQP